MDGITTDTPSVCYWLGAAFGRAGVTNLPGAPCTDVLQGENGEWKHGFEPGGREETHERRLEDHG